MKLFLTAALMLTTTTLSLGGPIEREGDGERRDKLNAMEARAFPPAALDSILAEPGGVTVYVTVSHTAPKSLLAVRRFTRLEERLARRGLKVIGIVAEESWDALMKRQEAGIITCELAADMNGDFRSVLLSDEDPDIYIMDRAGQLRFADVTVDSAAKAVSALLDETAEEAAGELARREASIETGEDPYEKPKTLTLADVPASAYTKASWPNHNTSRLSATNMQGKKLPAELGNETWITEKDRETAGHVLVIDFWATWCGPCVQSQPKLDRVQKKYKNDLMVLAIAGSGEDIDTVKGYINKNRKSYYNLYDSKQTISNALTVQGIPHTVILSSDGVIRWQGNPLNPSFESIVGQIVRADPFIKGKKEGKYSLTKAENTGGESVTQGNASAYESQVWPKHNSGNLYASDVQGQTFENLFEGLEWLDGDGAKNAGKVTIVDFWATWCGPCIKFSPTLDKIQTQYAKDVVAVGVSGQNDPQDKVVAYVESHSVSYRHAYAQDQTLYKKVGVSGIPHVLVISSDGVVRWQGFPGDVPEFERVVKEVVAADRKAREALEG